MDLAMALADAGRRRPRGRQRPRRRPLRRGRRRAARLADAARRRGRRAARRTTCCAPGKQGVYARSIVSSSLLGKMAAAAGQPYAETLTGFKWIGRVEGLAFGYEEALGYCVDPEHVRDKDGVSALLLLCELAAAAKAEGRTLTDLLDDIARPSTACTPPTSCRSRVTDLAEIAGRDGAAARAPRRRRSAASRWSGRRPRLGLRRAAAHRRPALPPRRRRPGDRPPERHRAEAQVLPRGRRTRRARDARPGHARPVATDGTDATATPWTRPGSPPAAGSTPSATTSRPPPASDDGASASPNRPFVEGRAVEVLAAPSRRGRAGRRPAVSAACRPSRTLAAERDGSERSTTSATARRRPQRDGPARHRGTERQSEDELDEDDQGEHDDADDLGPGPGTAHGLVDATAVHASLVGEVLDPLLDEVAVLAELLGDRPHRHHRVLVTAAPGRPETRLRHGCAALRRERCSAIDCSVVVPDADEQHRARPATLLDQRRAGSGSC